MKKLLPLFILIFALSAYSQSRNSAIYAVKINGAGLGTPHTTVKKKLGKPVTDVLGDAGECFASKMRTYTYSGLTLELHEETSDIPDRFYIANMSVTSARWTVSGVRVGSTTAAIRRKFGKGTVSKGDAPGETVLAYHLTETEGPGNLNFYIRKGKVVRIETFYIC